MSLDLDQRQRAMLQEMGVRVWWPEAGAAAREPLALESWTAPAITAPAQTRKESRNDSPPNEPATVDVLAAGIATMDWPTLRTSIVTCQACQFGSARRAPVSSAAETRRQADWMVVGEPPDEAEERAGAPFTGPAGQLLDNMLKAVGVSRNDAAEHGSAMAYVTNVVKCRPTPVRNPTPEELATCENYLRRELALVQPKVILALGRFAALTLLQESVPDVTSIPLGKLRGQIYRYQGIPVVVTYHPSYLLRTPLDKARAWADLCLALHAATLNQSNQNHHHRDDQQNVNESAHGVGGD